MRRIRLRLSIFTLVLTLSALPAFAGGAGGRVAGRFRVGSIGSGRLWSGWSRL
jgi:hypothetical protein